jgi:hypothetical protein
MSSKTMTIKSGVVGESIINIEKPRVDRNMPA